MEDTKKKPATGRSLWSDANANKLDKFIKQRWPFLIVLVLLVLAASYGLFKFAISGSGRADDSNTAIATSTQPVDTLVARRLDGVKVKPELANLMPYSVMVENYIEARPMAGISKANLVFELPVEGGITRLMTVFDASSTVERIGPVRSARPYFVDLAKAMESTYAHVGGSPEALNKISGLMGFRNLDEMANGQYFWRVTSKAAPHNVYTSTDQLSRAVQSKKWQVKDFKPWVYDDQATSTGQAMDIKIPYGGNYSVTWKYDASKDLYQRYLANRADKDADGSFVYAKNVLLVYTEESVLDDVGRLRIRTTGQGKAMLFRNGTDITGLWSRDATQFIKVQTAAGSDIAFARGTTWVEFITSPRYMPAFASSTAAVAR